MVELYNRDRYEIIGLREISHFIKQSCRNVCLEKCYKCIKAAETMQTKQSRKPNILIYSKLSNFKPRPNFVSLP